MPFDLSTLSPTVLLTAAIYVGLAGIYLLVVPGLLYVYLNQRWYVAGSVERLLIYAVVFVFFPGMLVLSPLLNFRPKRREV
ncbi:MAG: NAD(P)H-quinone oxidoreductase subunit L [Cyanobacteria bacterium J06626_23]